MWIENSRQSFLVPILSSDIARRIGSEDARDLGKDTDFVNRVQVRDNVTIGSLVLEEESTNVWLSAFHHFLDRCNHRWVANDHCLVKSGEEGASCDG